MSLSRFPQVTHELLSAYLDGAVTDEERALVERATAQDPEVAAQLAALRATVELLHTLPAVALPRSFAIDAVMLEVAEEQERAANVARQRAIPKDFILADERHNRNTGWWQRLLAGFQNMGPYRGGAAVAALLLLAFLAGNWSYVAQTVAPTTEVASLPAAAPAAEVAAVTEPTAAKVAVASPTTDNGADTVVAESAALEEEESDSSADEANDNDTGSDGEALALAEVTTTTEQSATDEDAPSTPASVALAAVPSSATIVEEPTSEAINTQANVAATVPAQQPAAPEAMAQADGSGGGPQSNNNDPTVGAAFMAASASDGAGPPGEDTQPLNPGQPAQVELYTPIATVENATTNQSTANQDTTEQADRDVAQDAATEEAESEPKMEAEAQEALVLADDSSADDAEEMGAVVAAAAMRSELATPTATIMATAAPTATVTVTPTMTVTATVTITPTVTSTARPTARPSMTPTPVPTPTSTPLAQLPGQDRLFTAIAKNTAKNENALFMAVRPSPL